MKLVIKIGVKQNGRIGVNISKVEKYDVGVRAWNQSITIVEEMIKNFGEIYTEDKLVYVGYEIQWNIKKIMRHGIGIATVDYKEKRNCPPQILHFGRKVYETLVTPIDGELAA